VQPQDQHDQQHHTALQQQPQLQQQQQHHKLGELAPPPAAAAAAVPPAAAALHAHHDVLNHRTGSVEYMAPEMLSKPTAAEVFHLVIAHGMDEEELPTYDEKVDVWSVGALVFEAR